MKKKRKKALIVIAVALLVVIIGAATAIKTIESNLEKLAAEEIAAVDLSAVPDGTYTGNFSVLPIVVRVSVTVKEHAITQIDILEHKSGQGQPAEGITSRVVAEQSLQVDAVTGATYSSKAILKAIEDALTA